MPATPPFYLLSSFYPAIDRQEHGEFRAEALKAGKADVFLLQGMTQAEAVLALKTNTKVFSEFWTSLKQEAGVLYNAARPNDPNNRTPDEQRRIDRLYEDLYFLWPSNKRATLSWFVQRVSETEKLTDQYDVLGKLIAYAEGAAKALTNDEFHDLWALYHLSMVSDYVRQSAVSYRLIGRVTDTNGQPRKDVRISAEDGNITTSTRAFGIASSDRNGYYAIRFSVLEGIDGSYPVNVKFAHPEIQTEVKQKLTFELGKADEPLVEALTFTPPVSKSKTVASTGVSIPGDVQAFLTANSISVTRLEDIRRMGGFMNIPGVNTSNASLKKLDALASLELLQDDMAKNSSLYERGYQNITEIALTPRGEFVEANSDLFGDYGAAQLHYMAKAGHLYGINLQAAELTAVPQHDSNTPSASGGAQSCDCPDCKSGVSPLAYLCDLIAFAQNNLRHGSPEEAVDLAFLSATFHQRFGDIRVSCAQLNEKICQNRIATEVLRSYLIEHPPTENEVGQLATAEKEYLTQAYELLLGKLGTSYTELRKLRGTTHTVAQQRLADRMGIVSVEGTVSTLEQLLIDLGNTANIVEGQNSGNAKGLEQLFGLRNTKRNVFQATPESKVEKWKKAKLRKEWKAADGLSNAYWDVSSPDRGIIVDPDVVTVDDLRNPSVGDPVFDLWMKRRGWVDQQIALFAADTEAKALIDIDKDNGWIILHGTGAVVLGGTNEITYENTGAYTPSRTYTVNRQYVIGGSAYLQVLEAIPENASKGKVSIVGTTTIINNPATALVPSLSAMLVRMSSAFSYDGSPVNTGWASAAPATFIANLTNLVAEAGKGEQQAIDDIAALGLTKDSAARLIALYKLNQEADDDSRANGGLTNEEWAEAKDILVSAVKFHATALWRTEEVPDPGTPIHLDPVSFRSAVKQPTAGAWPIAAEVIPLLDPDLTTSLNAPEITARELNRFDVDAEGTSDGFGDASALEVLAGRKQRLTDERNGLAWLFGTNIKSMLDVAFVNAINDWGDEPDAEWPNYLGVQADLASGITRGIASKFVEEVLRMKADDFIFLVEARRKQLAGEDFTENEKNRAVNTALAANKLIALHQEWVAQETGAADLQDTVFGVQMQWKLRKAALPKWRASQAQRDAWLKALAEHSERPIIDADLIGPGDLLLPAEGNPAYERFDACWRDMHGNAEYPNAGTGGVINSIGAAAFFSSGQQTDVNFDTLTQQRLGHVEPSLAAIHVQQEDGVDIRPRIAQLTLTSGEFNQLMGYRDLLVAGANSLTGEELTTIKHILAQVEKRRKFFDYRLAEIAAGITLSQDHFKIREQAIVSFPPQPDRPLTPWLASERDLILWRRTLKGRVEQEKSVLDAWQEALYEVDEAMMAHLRDALVRTTENSTQNLAIKARNLGDKLLIDLENNCCYKTNRVAVAIETLQQLIWKTRTADINAHYPTLRYQGDDFDEAWTWMGSYANWRAAMFVFMYPENVLHPSLRKNQTSAFREVIAATRGNRRFNASAVCAISKAYQEYLKDIANLKLACSVQAESYLGSGACGAPHDQMALFNFVFAEASNSSKCYWTSVDPTDSASPIQHQLWSEIPNMPKGASLKGATYYRNDSHQVDHIFLFYLSGDPDSKNKFFSTRLAVRTGEWETEHYTYEVDQADLKNAVEDDAFDTEQFNTDISSIAVLQNTLNWASPTIAISLWNWHLKEYYTFYQVTNAKGDKLAEGEWWDHWQTRLTSFNHDASENTRDLQGRIVDFICVQPHLDGNGVWQTWMYFFLLHYEYSEANFSRVVRLEIGNGTFLWADAGLYGNEFIVKLMFDRRSNQLVYLASDFVGWGTIDLTPTKAITPIGINGHTVSQWGNHALALTYNVQPFLHAGRYPVCCVNQYRENSNGRIPILAQDLGSANIVFTSGFVEQGSMLFFCDDIAYRLSPRFDEIPDISAFSSASEQLTRKQRSQTSWLLNDDGNFRLIEYVQEAYYFVPMQIAIQLHANGHYQTALDWFRTVYDFRQPLSSRKISYLLRQEETLTTNAMRIADWYADPLNPHAIAATRRHTYTRYTILCIVNCLLDFADAEFTSDTSESVPRARELYEDALSLMQLLVAPRNCAIDQLAASVKAQVDDASWLAAWNDTLKRLEPLMGSSGFGALLQSITTILAGGGALAVKLDAVNDAIDAAFSSHGLPTVTEVLNDQVLYTAASSSGALGSMDADIAVQQLIQKNAASYAQAMKTVTGLTTTELQTKNIPWLVDDRAASGFAHGHVKEYISPGKEHVLHNFSEDQPAKSFHLNNPFPNVWLSGVPFMSFCVVPNPVAGALVLKAEVELWKIRNCMNIAGMVRELDPFAAPTDSTTGIPVIGAAGGSIAIPSERTIPPSAYRYRTIAERARQLVGMAQQVEAAFLATLEKLDAERYSQLRAEQDIETSMANIKLQDLKINEANSGVTLAELQRDRATMQVNGLSTMIDEELNGYELNSIDQIKRIASYTILMEVYNRALQATNFAIGVAGAGGGVTAGISVAAAGIAAVSGFATIALQGTTSVALAYLNRDLQINQIWASFERRKQEWEFQRTLANQDVKIGDQQIKLANDRLRITGQEREIAVLQNEHARATLDFLKNKFTSAELFEWMSRVLEDAYSWFLQEATAMAMLAQRQLAFERQLDLPPFIRSDYWIVDGGSMGGVDLTGEGAVDRRGLTGSTRLLKDLTELDQYAFSTNSPKLQLTKTIALSELAPEELIALRDTGIARFYTTQEQFDRDYPGHYLRLIKRVSVTVIALTPPTKGIRATLTNGGGSNVVVGGTIFQERVIKRFPEVVALSSGVGDHGVFQLQPDGEFLHPFEGSGVETAWEFRMEKAANPFDFGSIADVLFTIEYEALNSFTYRNTVAQRLNQEPAPSAVAISLKNNLPDQWFDLHNPQVPGAGYQVSFQINQRDLAPNLSAPYSITRAVAYAIMKDGSEFRYLMGLNRGAPADTLSAFSEQGLALLSVPADPGDGPIGTWNLAFAPDGGTQPPDPFANKLVEDIFIVLTYEGESTPYLLV